MYAMNQFPQPTRPLNSYNLTAVPLQTPQPFVPTCFNHMCSGSAMPLPEEYFTMPQTSTAASEGEKKAVDDLLQLISEWHEKLPTSIKSQINLDELKGLSSRGVTDGGAHEGLTHKLERFKIRTVNVNGAPMEELEQKLERFKVRIVGLGGVVQEEEKK